MTIYHNSQICGTDSKITIERNESGYVFITVGETGWNITMEPKHVRQLVAALDTFEAAEMQAEK